jgi:hypothetical protein
MHFYDKEVLKSMGEGAVGGASVVASSGLGSPDPVVNIITIIFIPIGAVAGAVGGAVAPLEVAVIPTEKQLQNIEAAFKSAFVSADGELKYLQNAFVSEGNKLLPSNHFYPAENVVESHETLTDRSKKKTPVTDAVLYSLIRNITLSGPNAKDPALSIKIELRYFLKTANNPELCLRCYVGIWEGETRSLSEWQKEDGRYVKEEIITAFRELYPEAIAILFDSTSKKSTFTGKACSSTWSNCYLPDQATIADQAKWFCPQAEQGIADPQRRIGDVFNYGGGDSTNRDVIRAYVWYSLSASGNNTEAMIRLLELEKELTSEQLREAKDRLGKWVPGEDGQCKNDLIGAGLIK